VLRRSMPYNIDNLIYQPAKDSVSHTLYHVSELFLPSSRERASRMDASEVLQDRNYCILDAHRSPLTIP